MFMLKGSIKLNLSGAKIFYILKSKMWSGSIRKFVYFENEPICLPQIFKQMTFWHGQGWWSNELKSLQDCHTPLQPHHIPY
jgi:hypothetical protein